MQRYAFFGDLFLLHELFLLNPWLIPEIPLLLVGRVGHQIPVSCLSSIFPSCPTLCSLPSQCRSSIYCWVTTPNLSHLKQLFFLKHVIILRVSILGSDQLLIHFALTGITQFSSVQFSRSVVSDCLQPHESKHAKPPCPSSSPRVHSNSCPSSWWCHPAISSFVVPFFSCPQSVPASESFPVSQLFAWGGQSTGVSALASFLLKNTQGWSPSEWTG